jgi:hypothetical protein
MQLDPALADRLQAWAWQAVQKADELANAEGRPVAGSLLSSRKRRPRLQMRSPAGTEAVYSSGSPVPVVARVHSTAAPLESVEVLVDGAVVERLTQAPYHSQWTAPGDGSYTLRLRATDQNGRHARTDPVQIIIGDLPPEPARTPPNLDRLLWQAAYVGTPITIRLDAPRHEGPFASWKLMRGDEELAFCPDTAMRLEWTPDRAGYQDLHAVAKTEDGQEYRSETVRILVYDPADRPSGPFLVRRPEFPDFWSWNISTMAVMASAGAAAPRRKGRGRIRG